MQPGIDYIGVNVGFICHDGKGNILLHLRSDKTRDEHFTWDAGGGQVEFGETPEQAVIREVLEEYGCTPLRVDHIAQLTLLREHEGMPTHWLANIFAIKINPDDAKIMEPEKNLEMKWYALDALPEKLHTAPKNIIDNHKNKLLMYIFS